MPMKTLIIGDNIVHRLPVANTSSRWYSVVSYFNGSVREMVESKLILHFLKEQHYDRVVLCFGTVDLYLKIRYMDVVRDVVELYEMCKKEVGDIKVLGSFSKFKDYDLELFFRFGKDYLPIIENLHTRHLEGLYVSKRGKRRIFRKIFNL
jgi:hypothetical protein